MSKSIAGQGVGILGDDEGTDWVWRNGVPTLMKQKRAWYHKQLGEGRGTCSRPEDLKKLKKLARHGSACLQSQPFGKRRQKDHEFSANLVSKTRLCPNLPRPPKKIESNSFNLVERYRTRWRCWGVTGGELAVPYGEGFHYCVGIWTSS